MRIVLLLVLAGLAAVSGVWAVRQGVFDSERVRLVRMMTGNDPAAVRTAKLMEQGVSSETEAALFEAAGQEFDLLHGDRSVSLAWYLIEAFAFKDPKHAYFDWKEDSETVVPALNAMLDAYGVTQRPDLKLLQEHETAYAPSYSAMPIIVAHYAPIFEVNGLALMDLDANWDAYYFFVVRNSTANLWQSVKIEDEGTSGLRIGKIRPVPGAFTDKVSLTEVFDKGLGTWRQSEMPWYAGLPGIP